MSAALDYLRRELEKRKKAVVEWEEEHETAVGHVQRTETGIATAKQDVVDLVAAIDVLQERERAQTTNDTPAGHEGGSLSARLSRARRADNEGVGGA
ncbi:hypothetical protein [Agromyces sp. NPDC058104]|uniref:hypothetical protein n=1 Tax=Agromyces sp. NPDC058104 TaxID=3346342 RepID=UPI0036D9FD4A